MADLGLVNSWTYKLWGVHGTKGTWRSGVENFEASAELQVHLCQRTAGAWRIAASPRNAPPLGSGQLCLGRQCAACSRALTQPLMPITGLGRCMLAKVVALNSGGCSLTGKDSTLYV